MLSVISTPGVFIIEENCGMNVLILKRNVASFSILYHEDGGSIFLLNVNKFMPHYVASYHGCYCHQSVSPVTAGLHIPRFGGLGSLNNFIAYKSCTA